MRGAGRKGGRGATAGRTAAVYEVDLPNGTTATKRDFFPPAGEARGYVFEAEGRWHVAGIAEPDAPHLSHMRQCPARRLK